MGVHIGRLINDRRGPPVFKILGQVHRQIGYLLPPNDSPPKFIQLYIYDIGNEVRNRLKCLAMDETPVGPLEPSIVDDLMTMLDDHNPFVKNFRTTKERLGDYLDEEFII
jgi:hypothetical protein